MSARITKEVTIDASPEQVYAVLTDAAQFSSMSGGAPAEIDPAPGGAFSCFGGMITGRNVECSPGEVLVQAWRAKTWPAGTYSIVCFRLGREGNATKVTMDHAGFPEDQGEHLDKGWDANYWEPMSKLFA